MEKLVRDNMPCICSGQGHTPMNFRWAAPKEFNRFILDKIVEEATEVSIAPSRENLIEELADLKEVIKALQTKMAISDAEVEEVRLKKHAARGGFLSGVIWDGKK